MENLPHRNDPLKQLFFKSKYGDPRKKKMPLPHAYFETTFGATI